MKQEKKNMKLEKNKKNTSWIIKSYIKAKCKNIFLGTIRKRNVKILFQEPLENVM